MSTFLVLVLLAVAMPLCGFGVLLALGRRLGEPLGGYVGTAFSFASFGAAVAAMVSWINRGDGFGFGLGPLLRTVAWLPVGDHAGQRHTGFLDFAVYVDSFTVVMLAMVTLIAAVVHLYSLQYMKDEARFVAYFGRLSLFGFAMTGLLLSGTLLQLLVFWELVGVCSYLLIGFWHERPEARDAATKAFIVNRVGDVGFIIGLGLLVSFVGNTTLPDLWGSLAPSHQTIVSGNTLTLIGCLLFCGAIGKSAQFPLHTWLPDAMAGPTPVSALIHAATMVAAGVFLLVRIDPILTADARLFVTVIGAITIAIGSLCALAQRDLKQALAFSTMAQLGYMVLAVGVGSRDGAGFHLLTHAFFKALLFLAAGVVIHGMHHKSRLEHFGGLLTKMPVTAIAFAIGGMAMSAVPYFSGYYSKEAIVGHAAAWVDLAGGRGGLWSLVLWVPVAGAYLTPLYLTRLWMLTFAGRPRDVKAFARATEPGLLSFPLVVLSGLAIVSGYEWFPLRSMVTSSATETRAYVVNTAQVDPLEHDWPAVLPAADPDTDGLPASDGSLEYRAELGHIEAARLTRWAWLVGLLAGVALYWRAFAISDRLARLPGLGAMRLWLRHRMYFDDLYRWVIVGTVRTLGDAVVAVDRLIDAGLNVISASYAVLGRLAAALDGLIVDGVVRGIGATVLQGGRAAGATEVGRIRSYVAAAVVILAAIVGGAVVWTVRR